MSSETVELNELKTDEGGSLGVSFSGGGIRSAAFSSGVLRRLLHHAVPVDYLSCVSGGGFTGSAYLEWKYRNGGNDDPQWHEKFFNQMRKNASTLCVWRNPLRGLCESVFLILMVLFIGIIIPLLIWLPIAFPVAYLIDYGFGDVLRSSFTCKWDSGYNFTNLSTMYSRLRRTENLNCFLDRQKDDRIDLTILFLSLLLSIAIFFCLYKISSRKLQHYFYVPAAVSTLTLAFTFLPWIFEMYISLVPVWLKGLLLFLGVLLWMGIPPLRSKASWTLLLYFYAFVIRWRVYKNPILGIDYVENTFLFILWASILMFLASPFLSSVQQNTIHAFYRCKLQKAFYTPRSSGCLGCGGISFSDFYQLAQRYDKGNEQRTDAYQKLQTNEPDKPVLTLGDLAGIKPYYICNVLVDNWTYKTSEMSSDSYTILTLSPHLIERIDDDEEKDFDENSIQPHHVKLSDAMATSAAVVSCHMGAYTNEAILSLQTMLGLTMGKSWISDRRFFKYSLCSNWTPFILQTLLGLPLLILPLIELLVATPNIMAKVLIGVFIASLSIVCLIAVLPTGSSRTSKIESFTRWCIVNIFQVRYIRETLGIYNVGEVPPPILYLSDGGHVENLGLLALLKRRLQRIIIADGGFCASESETAVELLHSLKLAREKLHCSFSGLDGRDIQEDIRDNFVNPPGNTYPRFYKFRVDYYEKDLITNQSIKVGNGIIMLLAPRHPNKGIMQSEDPTWSTYEQDTGIKMKQQRWGQGPVLTESEVDRLTLACSECCHCGCYKCCSEPICGKFPFHITANQFFTGSLFSAYHREGYRAAMDAEVEAFAAIDNEQEA